MAILLFPVVLLAITWRHYIWARHGRKSRTCRWNFDAICCSSGGITTSGLDGHMLFPVVRQCRIYLWTLSLSWCGRRLCLPHWSYSNTNTSDLFGCMSLWLWLCTLDYDLLLLPVLSLILKMYEVPFFILLSCHLTIFSLYSTCSVHSEDRGV